MKDLTMRRALNKINIILLVGVMLFGMMPIGYSEDGTEGSSGLGAIEAIDAIDVIEEIVVQSAQVLEVLGGIDGAFPELNEAGFLDEGEFVYENPEEGVWRYASQTLRIEIIKTYTKTPRLTYYTAEIWAMEGEIFHCVVNDKEKDEYPKNTAKKHGTVFALNSDYHHARGKKSKGIIIRNGEIVSDITEPHNTRNFPNLDTLAIFPDGRLEVYPSDAYTAQEYLDMGAIDVLAFGPYLIKDGEINTEGLEIYGNTNAPRAAIGMIEPGHYIGLMVEGRHDKSKGCMVVDLAEMLYEKGCQTAFNLDGGKTAVMTFMGKQIITVGNTEVKNASARKAPEILGIGFSQSIIDEYEASK